ncbi:hypothetical protein ISS07_03900 [Candidatus Woesearchaeota archaeon]|nr:hypothetical protein [Candidatus Woesearchaeota archaeon]
MKHSIKVGFSFGITSGIITTLGLMVGLNSGTHSKLAVIGGILTISIADAFSDALGIHISEESENKHTTKEIWQSTIATLVSKFIFAISFIIPVLLLPLFSAIIVAMVGGLSVLGIFSFYIAHKQGKKPWKAVLEHLVIAVIVITLTHYVGNWTSTVFG